MSYFSFSGLYIFYHIHLIEVDLVFIVSQTWSFLRHLGAFFTFKRKFFDKYGHYWKTRYFKFDKKLVGFVVVGITLRLNLTQIPVRYF